MRQSKWRLKILNLCSQVKALAMHSESREPRTHSSRTVFIAIGLVLVAMTGFMFICKHFGILNPRATWDLEFQNLKTIILTYDAATPKQPAADISPAAVKKHLEFYAGSQIALRESGLWVVKDFEKKELDGKPVVMLKLALNSGELPAREMTFAIFPIADRQLQKTYKFVVGSFLWRAYCWNTQGTNFVVSDENVAGSADQVQMIAANYLNDYFVFAVGHSSPKQMAIDLGNALSFYHEDFIKVL
jgi:hypothetical protein